MQEREILLDLLSGTKHSINCYTNAIMEGSNQQLRSTFQTLRDEAEQMQYQLYQMAEQKGYYHSAPGANQNDIQHIKQSLTNGMTGNTNTNNMNLNFAGGRQTNQMQNQNVMSDSNSHAMINSNMNNTTDATSQISTNTNENLSNSNTKKSKKNR